MPARSLDLPVQKGADRLGQRPVQEGTFVQDRADGGAGACAGQHLVLRLGDRLGPDGATLLTIDQQALSHVRQPVLPAVPFVHGNHAVHHQGVDLLVHRPLPGDAVTGHDPELGVVPSQHAVQRLAAGNVPGPGMDYLSGIEVYRPLCAQAAEIDHTTPAVEGLDLE
jgi:hypothetical protein